MLEVERMKYFQLLVTADPVLQYAVTSLCTLQEYKLSHLLT